MHMNINATLLGQGILLLMLVVGGLAYWLARRRSERPALIATLCALLSLFPPLGLLALLLLVLHLDRPTGPANKKDLQWQALVGFPVFQAVTLPPC